MGFMSKVQVIQRGMKNRQFYFICPAPLAQALEIEKGEERLNGWWRTKQRQTIRRVSLSQKSGRPRYGK